MSHGMPTEEGPVLESIHAVREEESISRFEPTTGNNKRKHYSVALLTGGGDKPYALGMTEALTEAGVFLEFIGSDDLAVANVVDNPRVNFLNLRGDQRPDANPIAKFIRVLRYYGRLIRYTSTAKPAIFHILWNNKFELFDRTLLMLYYKLLRKQVVFTVHNVNAGSRDARDSAWNRLSLKVQYKVADHLFVHTQRMKEELSLGFGVARDKVSVIPFGINNTIPRTCLSSAEAKARLGIATIDKTLLFFGNIAPYKGLDDLVAAFCTIARKEDTLRLIIAGRLKCSQEYWKGIDHAIRDPNIADRIILRIEYIPDEEAELYFKAADVLVLPYRRIFQSGVLFLGYGFGLPALVANVGSLKEEIIEGETGFLFRAEDAAELAEAIEKYFGSDLYRDLSTRRDYIKAYANERYSWTKVAAATTAVYHNLVS